MKLDTVIIAITVVLATQTGYLLAGPNRPAELSSAEFIPDTAITTKVQTAFSLEPTLRASEVNVKTFRGTVRLVGFVASDDQATRAEDIASRIEGVREVRSHLRVQQFDPAATLASARQHNEADPNL